MYALTSENLYFIGYKQGDWNKQTEGECDSAREALYAYVTADWVFELPYLGRGGWVLLLPLLFLLLGGDAHFLEGNGVKWMAVGRHGQTVFL